MAKYWVFSRVWWRQGESGQGLIPNPRARKTSIGFADTVGGARDMCRVWNKNNKPGRLDRKAEFTSQF